MEFAVGSLENLTALPVGFEPLEQKVSDAKLENVSPLCISKKVGYRNYEHVLADRNLVGGGSPVVGLGKVNVKSEQKGKKEGLDMTLPAQAKTSKIKSVVRPS